jgi:hypothetical protein
VIGVGLEDGTRVAVVLQPGASALDARRAISAVYEHHGEPGLEAIQEGGGS